MLLHPLLDCCDVLPTSLISKEVISFADSMVTFEEYVSQTWLDITDGTPVLLWPFPWNFSFPFHCCFTPHPAHLTLNHLTLSPVPLLFWLVLLSKIKSTCIHSISQNCLTQPLQSLCFHLNLSPGLKQESSSVQWYLWTPKSHVGIYTQDASCCQILKATRDQHNHLWAICSCGSTHTFPSWSDLEAFQSLSVVTVLLQ